MLFREMHFKEKKSSEVLLVIYVCQTPMINAFLKKKDVL